MGCKEIWRLSVAILAVAVLTACIAGASSNSLPFEPTPEHLQKREMRTRMYEGISEASILSASAGVLQDLGFRIIESEPKLGVVIGDKVSDVHEDDILGFIFSIFTLSDDDYQKFWISIAVRPASTENDDNHYVSVTFQRIVWNDDNQIIRSGNLEAPELYQDFFDRLSKSVFLEAQGI